MQFQPNFFVDIANTLKDKKKALNFYKSEMKKYPHSRSVKAIINKNISIGNTFGLNACEAFQIVRKLEK
jgi:LmbE family N-acetylglucosaminyl deacetylase